MILSLFTDAIADKSDGFTALTRHASVVYYEVYTGEPCYEWKSLFERATPDERFFRFNMQSHSKNACASFLEFGYIIRATSNLPIDAILRFLCTAIWLRRYCMDNRRHT